jgi:hypothetical protein
MTAKWKSLAWLRGTVITTGESVALSFWDSPEWVAFDLGLSFDSGMGMQAGFKGKNR